ncbi:MAG TPA: AGE family epimerase/isomerase [Spirochaetia bacterium]|nr:AGE family epimerase/isomerase [Spirochaetia bacterium]
MNNPELKNRFAGLHAHYKRELLENIVPFWVHRGPDRDHGGFLNCFDNRGEKLLSTHKYTWSQGRATWMFSELFKRYSDPVYLEIARLTADFIIEKALMPEDVFVTLTDREGKPLEADREKQNTSTYADCFAVYGLSNLAVAANEKRYLEIANRVYNQILLRVADGTFKTEPLILPKTYKKHGISMIMVETSRQLAEAFHHFGVAEARAVSDRADSFVREIQRSFVDKDRQVLFEVAPVEGTRNLELLLERYILPGHSIESSWMMIRQALKSGNQQAVDTALDVIRWMAEKGWDREYGGMFYFLNFEGSRPDGDVPSDHGLLEMCEKIVRDWDLKLWWVHSEALYSLLLGYHLTKEDFFLEWFQRYHEYTFRTFPNPDKSVGEWIQIRDRMGRPVDHFTMLPVKDPYHITRNLIFIIDLLEQELLEPEQRQSSP